MPDIPEVLDGKALKGKLDSEPIDRAALAIWSI